MAKVVGKENPDGTTTVKVKKGAKVVTGNGKVATGGKIVDTLPSKTKTRAATKKSKEIFDEIDEMWDDEEDFSLDSGYDSDSDSIDEEPANKVFLYVTRDGIIGNVHDDNLQIIDTSGIADEDIYQIANAEPEDRAEKAAELRDPRGAVFASKHWFNDTGDFGVMKDLRIVDGGELTKSEMRDLMDAEDPFDEARNYDSGAFDFRSAMVSVKKGSRSNSTDDFLDDDMIIEGTSYRLD